MARILTIDDEKLVCMLIGDVARQAGHVAACAHDLDSARHLMRNSQDDRNWDVIFLDVLLPDGNGFDILPELSKLPSRPEIIMITGHADPDDAESALRHGVATYLVKPLNNEKASRAMRHALAFRNSHAQSNGRENFSRTGLVGNSPAIRSCLELAAKAAVTEVNVLLYGETGTGKGLLAQAIQTNSGRANRPFVIVDCAALTESVVESELFGHLKGSFTGADRDRQGLVAQAHGGTLFLDEVGELPMSIQRTFLRVLEEGRFRPVGSKHEQESDFRLIAATNRNLEEMAHLGLFRSDLLYRLKGMTVTLPPLRERMQDLQTLITYFLDTHCMRRGVCGKALSDDFLETVHNYRWPGNVRELSHAVERSLAAGAWQNTLFAAHLPMEVRVQAARQSLDNMPTELPGTIHGVDHNAPSPPSGGRDNDSYPRLKDFRHEQERHYLGGLLEHTGSDVAKAAKIAGISRGHLYELLKKHDMDWR